MANFLRGPLKYERKWHQVQQHFMNTQTIRPRCVQLTVEDTEEGEEIVRRMNVEQRWLARR